MKHRCCASSPVSDELYAVSELLIERVSTQRIWLFDLGATGLDTT
jgi:hypothetical protein